MELNKTKDEVFEDTINLIIEAGGTAYSPTLRENYYKAIPYRITIPRDMYEYMKNRKKEGSNLVQALWEAYEFRTELGDVAKTINNDSERFAKAWMAWPNVEVEDENI